MVLSKHGDHGDGRLLHCPEEREQDEQHHDNEKDEKAKSVEHVYTFLHTSRISSTASVGINPAASCSGFWNRSPIGMKARLYHHIARSRLCVSHHIPQSSRKDERGCIPNTALRSTAR